MRPSTPGSGGERIDDLAQLGTAQSANSGARIGAIASRNRGCAAVRLLSSGSASRVCSSWPSSGVTPDAAEQIGGEHHVALGCESVGDVLDVGDEPPDLVDEDDSAARGLLGRGAVDR